MAKAKQEFLDGMKPPSIKEIDTAADAFVEARNTRMRHTVKEKERKIILLDLMHANGLEEYLYDGKVIRIEGKENIKVNEIDPEEGEPAPKAKKK